MSIKFEFYETPRPQGSNKKRYHARVVSNQTVTTKKLTQEIQNHMGTNRADVLAALSLLGDALVDHLLEGEHVHLEGIGYFGVSLSCPETRNPKDTRAPSVKVKTVTFRPDKQLKRKMLDADIIRSDHRPHSMNHSSQALDELLTNYFAQHPTLCRRTFQQIALLTQSTAHRLLKRLVADGKLRNVGLPRTPVYMPCPGHYGK